MTHEQMKLLIEELDKSSNEVMFKKNKAYSSPDDALHNFNSGASIFGDTPAKTCWGYLTKHLTALRDMIERNDFSNREDFLEKCKDSINYIRFIWCIGNNENDMKALSNIEGSYKEKLINQVENIINEKENE